MSSALGEPNVAAIASFLVFVGITLVITWWAARRTRTSSQFFTADSQVSAVQNGFALAGDYMSAASFLGIAGMVATSGFDGLIYSVGWLVGWPVITFLIAEPLRNLGKYTFADVVAYRLRQQPVRIAAAISTLAVVSIYLIAQMVGAGELIKLMFGIEYRYAIMLVGATLLAVLVLARFGWSPLELFAEARRQYGDGVMAPGAQVANPLDAVSLGIALMFGTAGLPHILMRFYTVPDAQTARRSVALATSLIGFFYLVTFVLGFGASVIVGRTMIGSVGEKGNMAAPLLAEALGGTGFLGFISAVAFATILAVVAGLTLSGAAALAHDLWGHVVRKGQTEEREQLRVARYATIGLAVLAIGLGIVFEGQNVAFMVGLAFAIAASANFPALLLSMVWKRFTTRGAVASMVTGTVTTLVLIILSPTVWKDLLGNPSAIFPLKNPGVITVPLSFLVGIVVSLARREPEAEAKFAEATERMHFGPKR